MEHIRTRLIELLGSDGDRHQVNELMKQYYEVLDKFSKRYQEMYPLIG
ncbi:hypothetical protein [Photobacterium damselae]